LLNYVQDLIKGGSDTNKNNQTLRDESSSALTFIYENLVGKNIKKKLK